MIVPTQAIAIDSTMASAAIRQERPVGRQEHALEDADELSGQVGEAIPLDAHAEDGPQEDAPTR